MFGRSHEEGLTDLTFLPKYTIFIFRLMNHDLNPEKIDDRSMRN
ncbi:hypothetical protein [Lysinibacillus xylanilyticus]